MILMVSSSARSVECAAALAVAVSEQVEVAANLRRANALLRGSEYSAVVLDEPLVETEPEGVDTLLHISGLAVPIYVNLPISSTERITREVKKAMRRHEEERLIAMRAAESLLRSEIRGAITGILLSSELALHIPELPHDAQAKLRSVCQLATQIRNRLESIQ
ncbi:MAG TPA: hypothetical protein VN622_02680 [Clostridia bacterium]|nr:hypothetical protein [Clostridia bacterium]